MLPIKFQNVLIGAATVLVASAGIAHASVQSAQDYSAASSFVDRNAASGSVTDTSKARSGGFGSTVTKALNAFANVVRPLSRPRALEDAFKSYFAYKNAHPGEVRKPFLYFVDYGLPSTTPRGYVFDMKALKLVEGPFTVAHGRGSAANKAGIPTRFSNAIGSAATSLGLYIAKATYAFSGKSGGQSYSSVGLRLDGVSDGFNDNALRRGVVAHGAPYVTPSKAGRSEGCPAMEQTRAQRLLPKLADGGMVFLYAPDAQWMDKDPWIAAGEDL
jgi:hypothetical protein